MVNDFIAWFQDISQKDIDRVGGKNASLGEMTRHLSSLAIAVPEGFALTVKAYQVFLKENQLDSKIVALLKNLDIHSVQKLKKIATEIKTLVLAAEFPKEIENALRAAYDHLLKNNPQISLAVRSSATAEDLPTASFAGQQETFLNVRSFESLIDKIKEVYASLYGERAITYRAHHQFPQDSVMISVGIQKMVRSDLGVSGVMFTLDTESGFKEVVLINASYGLGELIVQGAVNPDEFYISKAALNRGHASIIRKTLGSKQQKMIYGSTKEETVCVVPVEKQDQLRFSLSETELEYLAKQALLIEQHYGRPMDIEWAKDGQDNQIYILQARPETATQLKNSTLALERYSLNAKGKIIIEGRSVGQRINHGKARVLKSHHDMSELQPGEILITDMTDPDWEPVMKLANGIITNRGGRTCHAAIIARELGLPAVVGTGSATEKIKTGDLITVSCAEGDVGYVYEGLLAFDIKRYDLTTLPDLPFKIMMIIGNPERAFDFQKLPNAGVGLARLEFIINQIIGIHPRACLDYEQVPSDIKQKILEKISGYENPVDFYVNKLSEGIATLASAFWPKPVIVRLSDFKSNEYANLLGGGAFEPKEENPMLGFRGASRYLSKEFRDCFALECQAVLKVREKYGLSNVEVMIPFVRTPKEAEAVILELEKQGLKRGVNGLRIIMMCEIPANAIQAEEFLKYFDGFSIGSNDLTQLTLGLDRDSGLVAHHFDERDSAVLTLLRQAIEACKLANKSIGICGQGPSDYPDFARWLMEKGIDSVSLNPDAVITTWLELS